MLSFAEVDSVSQKRWRELQKLAVIAIRYPLHPIQNLRYGLYLLARPILWADDCPPNVHNCADNILGSGVFPTSSTANPTSTIAALALRAAATIGKRLRLGERI